jgi:hypothetical protein
MKLGPLAARERSDESDRQAAIGNRSSTARAAETTENQERIEVLLIIADSAEAPGRRRPGLREDGSGRPRPVCARHRRAAAGLRTNGGGTYHRLVVAGEHGVGEVRQRLPQVIGPLPPRLDDLQVAPGEPRRRGLRARHDLTEGRPQAPILGIVDRALVQAPPEGDGLGRG